MIFVRAFFHAWYFQHLQWWLCLVACKPFVILSLYNAGGFFFAWKTVFQELSQKDHLSTEAEASEAEKSQQGICYKGNRNAMEILFFLPDFSFTSSKGPQAWEHALWLRRCREMSGRWCCLKRRYAIPYRSINFLVTELVWGEQCSPLRLKQSAPTYLLKITNKNSCWKERSWFIQGPCSDMCWHWCAMGHTSPMGTWENPLCLSCCCWFYQQTENTESEIRSNLVHQALGTVLLLATATQGV